MAIAAHEGRFPGRPNGPRIGIILSGHNRRPGVTFHVDTNNRALRFFLAGIMQGSHLGAVLHNQDYRDHLKQLLRTHFPQSEIYDPLADHANSLDYDDDAGRRVFLHHNQMCAQVDVVIAFVPEASMGTAIEIWEAWRHGRKVITISRLTHNWTVKFLSNAVYPDLDAFSAALASGRVTELICGASTCG